MKVAPLNAMRSLIRGVDPRRSLAAGTAWLIVALSITFSVAAAVWVGGVARDNIVEQHERRLALETDQLSSDLSQAVAARLGAIRAAQQLLGPTLSTDPKHSLMRIFDELNRAYPQFGWWFVANETGEVLNGNATRAAPANLAKQPWFISALRSPYLGTIEATTQSSASYTESTGVTSLGDMAAPVIDSNGQTVGVLVTQLRWQRSAQPTERLTDEPDTKSHAEASLLDHDGTVMVGMPGSIGKPWPGLRAETHPGDSRPLNPHFEILPGGKRLLVARTPLGIGAAIAPSWTVQLAEPRVRVYQRADALTKQILWVAIGLGILTATLGGFGARHLTARLKRLAVSVGRVKLNPAAPIDIPNGIDEVAQLAEAFADLLSDLQSERAELKSLSTELERRVAIRTSEVERLAEEARYAAIVRERLKIARDLHDTLAHSMMAMLSEIRYLRRLQTHNPAALGEELARAEDVAHQGLKEARTAITQMRETAVRDTGLGPALSAIFERFVDSTGLSGDFTSDPQAARFGDERAETLVRMAHEALRNIERHARATRVTMSLHSVNGNFLELTIQDNGIGFDPQTARSGHYGIVGLYEQAEIIGAEFEIRSILGEGTNLSIRLRVTPMAFGRTALQRA